MTDFEQLLAGTDDPTIVADLGAVATRASKRATTRQLDLATRLQVLQGEHDRALIDAQLAAEWVEAAEMRAAELQPDAGDETQRFDGEPSADDTTFIPSTAGRSVTKITHEGTN